MKNYYNSFHQKLLWIYDLNISAKFISTNTPHHEADVIGNFTLRLREENLVRPYVTQNGR